MKRRLAQEAHEGDLYFEILSNPNLQIGRLQRIEPERFERQSLAYLCHGKVEASGDLLG